ncbi:hypothetical protein N7490_007314 [Penicillium lividum]|nr:hypothetical protein N7490_007314 [Penicillium lividum]
MSGNSEWISRKLIHDLNLTRGRVVRVEKREWTIDKLINFGAHQMHKEDIDEENPSLALFRLSCHDTADPSIKDSANLDEQAIPFRHQELTEYKTISRDQWVSKFTPKLLDSHESKQSPNLIVPGGFLTRYVWEIVPGVRLGDEGIVATGFWDNIKDLRERDMIRQ